MRNERIAFLGGGNMAEAIIGGLLAGGISMERHLVAADISAERRALLEEKYGIRAVADNADAVRGADVVVLAIKPQQVSAALAPLAGIFTNQQLLVSICAGLPTLALEKLVPARVARVMPNLPALVRQGVSAICGGARATAADLDLVEDLFAGVGAVVRLPEGQMN